MIIFGIYRYDTEIPVVILVGIYCWEIRRAQIGLEPWNIIKAYMYNVFVVSPFYDVIL